MKKIVISLGLLLMSSYLIEQTYGQEIRLDTMIFSSCEIFPFDQVERITRLSWEDWYHFKQ